MMRSAKFVLVLLCFNAIGVLAQKPRGYDLKKGDVYIMTATVKQDIQQQVQGQSLSTDQNLINTDKLEVMAVDGDVYTIKVTGVRRVISLKSPMGNTEMDSDDQDQTSLPLRIMNGKSYTVEMNRLGKILSISGTSDMRDAIRNEFNNVGMGAVADQMLTNYNDDLLKNSMESLMAIYDQDNGADWTIKTASVVNNIPVEMENTFSWSDDDTLLALAKINVNGTMSVMGTEVNTEMNGNQETTIDLDVKTGMPKKVKAIQTVEGKLYAPGITIPMTIISETNTTFEKK
ncbi:hypothetical protein BFP97_19775 [Roseivirga sp. 4D4]|uniref:DUF6263 family protein n=1 Tax=Roseivirga sp. 4D4 TaxID=1889784 RepID=UPI0008532CBD|nr:DUF6263 family protein [Roseivirga sp. 4D4]OEK03617.1 hypothetical protein BFP97_19775 [Roseivirga sp. 4D4]